MPRPRLWLDIDGVINVVADPFNLPAGCELLPVRRSGFLDHIIYRPQVADRLRALADLADIRWHTAWFRDAPVLGEALGFPPLPFTPLTADIEGGPLRGWWKTAAITAHTGPQLWIDDDLRGDETELRGLAISGLSWVAPDTFIGLTDTDLTEIETWVEANSAG